MSNFERLVIFLVLKKLSVCLWLRVSHIVVFKEFLNGNDKIFLSFQLCYLLFNCLNNLFKLLQMLQFFNIAFKTGFGYRRLIKHQSRRKVGSYQVNHADFAHLS